VIARATPRPSHEKAARVAATRWCFPRGCQARSWSPADAPTCWIASALTLAQQSKRSRFSFVSIGILSRSDCAELRSEPGAGPVHNLSVKSPRQCAQRRVTAVVMGHKALEGLPRREATTVWLDERHSARWCCKPRLVLFAARQSPARLAHCSERSFLIQSASARKLISNRPRAGSHGGQGAELAEAGAEVRC